MKKFLTQLIPEHVPTWEEFFMQTAFNISQKAHCIHFKVGVVIAFMEKGKETIITIGYNGPIRGYQHCDIHGCIKDKGGKCIGSHAEMNAITNIAGSSANLSGATLFVTLSPCLECAKHIANSNLKGVIYLEDYAKINPKKEEEANAALILIKTRKECKKFTGKIYAPNKNGIYELISFEKGKVCN